jgi:AhpD family alkylhydroperoxidase
MHEVVQTYISQVIEQAIKPRFDLPKAAPEGYKAMLALEEYLDQCGLEQALIHLVKLRVSQMNRCAFCIDMHWKELRALGECETRLYSLDTWRECPYYSGRERAALRWAEAATQITAGVSDGLYQDAREYFSEKELSDLTLAVATINAWNRLSISAGMVAGQYRADPKDPISDNPISAPDIRDLAGKLI